MSELLFVGIGGYVTAIDSVSGQEIWRQKLKGSNFVSIQVSDNVIYAGTAGELFCLDRASGNIQWHNSLKGLGTGFITFGNASSVIAAAACAAAQAAAAGATFIAS